MRWSPIRSLRRSPAARAVRRSSCSIIAVAAMALLPFGWAGPIQAAEWRFEAEFINPGNCHVQASQLQVVNCAYASEGQALEGLAMLGDWAELSVTFDREVCIVDSIRCASLQRTTWQFLLEFRSDDTNEIVATSEHASTQGRGTS